jgi:AcrR family transcriptional regulator
MKSAIKARSRSVAPRLTREDWLDAAFKAVVEGGFDNVRVLVIADALGVTRGSFYWHFTDHADLVGALLARWHKREVDLDQKVRCQATDDPQADLRQMLEAALAHAGSDVENLRFELALRGLGRRNPAVAKMLLEVDQLRFDLFEQAFMRLTGDAMTAAELAALFYLAIAGGHQALSRPSSTVKAKKHLKAVITKFLIDRQAPIG